MCRKVAVKHQSSSSNQGLTFIQNKMWPELYRICLFNRNAEWFFIKNRSSTILSFSEIKWFSSYCSGVLRSHNQVCSFSQFLTQIQWLVWFCCSGRIPRLSLNQHSLYVRVVEKPPPPPLTGEQYGKMEPKYPEGGPCRSVLRPQGVFNVPLYFK